MQRTKPLKASDVAVMFGVGPKTIVRWCNEGMLPYTLTLGNHRRFDPEVIAAIVATRQFEVGAPPEAAAS